MSKKLVSEKILFVISDILEEKLEPQEITGRKSKKLNTRN